MIRRAPLDVKRIEEKITRKIRAIIPLHLYGQPADMDPILAPAWTTSLSRPSATSDATSVQRSSR
jgi:dTDP-4-amino-4,6-dideoxygalactose transaminase